MYMGELEWREEAQAATTGALARHKQLGEWKRTGLLSYI